MDLKKIGNKIIVRIDKGEEIIESLKQICKNINLKSGSLSGIGAVNKVTMGLFKTKPKQYHSKELIGDFEITSLSGNISTMNGEVYLHCHTNISDMEFNTFGGHLNSAIVSSTCEIIIDVIDGEVGRKFSEEIGLNLFKL